jgi:hypothetical protein
MPQQDLRKIQIVVLQVIGAAILWAPMMAGLAMPARSSLLIAILALSPLALWAIVRPLAANMAARPLEPRGFIRLGLGPEVRPPSRRSRSLTVVLPVSLGTLLINHTRAPGWPLMVAVCWWVVATVWTLFYFDSRAVKTADLSGDAPA